MIPAPVNHGLVFRKTRTRSNTVDIRADWRNVRDLPLCTCLSDASGNQVRTVEHLLAACYGAGIDNALIEIEGDEVPLLDGSAAPFVESFCAAGIVRQDASRRTVKIKKAFEVQDGPRWIRVEPHESFRIEVQTYIKPFGRLPWWQADIDRKTFVQDIVSARTFGSLRDGLLAKCFTWFLRDPICQGANRNNAIVIFLGQVISPGGLRYADEFSRHRVLDVIGDLMLAGGDFRAKFTCFSPVHRLLRKVLEAIFADREAYELIGERIPDLTAQT
jgi:UDP-3-O-[3-hydroxymyristoyl] N-acetylglucosamine deacetylase